MMRIGSSLRTQRRIAVDAVTGSSSRISPAAGSTAATGSAEKRMMTKPIRALQNPATIQGKVTANRTSADDIEDSESAGRQRQRGEP